MKTGFCLRNVLVEPDRLRLSSSLGVVEIQPRVMDVIVGLAADGDALVLRATLIERVWGPTQVGYHALARAIHEARKALAVVAPGEAFIETIPQRGYRLHVAPARVASPNTGPVIAPPRLLRTSARGGRIGVTLVLILALGLVMHALEMHGSALHLVVAAAVLTAAVRPWIPIAVGHG